MDIIVIIIMLVLIINNFIDLCYIRKLRKVNKKLMENIDKAISVNNMLIETSKCRREQEAKYLETISGQREMIKNLENKVKSLKFDKKALHCIIDDKHKEISELRGRKL